MEIRDSGGDSSLWDQGERTADLGTLLCEPSASSSYRLFFSESLVTF